MGCWFGHKWKTMQEVDVPPVRNIKSIKGAEDKTFIMLAQGYKRVHQECERCGERRVFHEI